MLKISFNMVGRVGIEPTAGFLHPIMSRVLATNSSMRPIKFGGCPRSRTANVYHEGPDLQSGAEHAISARHPKLFIR